MDDGMLFPKARAMHTCGMRTAIDILWLKQVDASSRYRVVGSEHRITAGKSRYCKDADTLLELAPGALAAFGDPPGFVRLEAP
jgi:hypothetical protein